MFCYLIIFSVKREAARIGSGLDRGGVAVVAIVFVVVIVVARVDYKPIPTRFDFLFRIFFSATDGLDFGGDVSSSDAFCFCFTGFGFGRPRKFSGVAAWHVSEARTTHLTPKTELWPENSLKTTTITTLISSNLGNSNKLI
jgi:hypothetical protein